MAGERLNRIMIFGHRGAGVYEPENTLRAIRRALRDGADGAEVDVHLTQDGHPVLIHDDTVDRTTNGSGPVSAFPLRKLKELNAGEGEEVPTLQESIGLIKGQGKLLLHVKIAEAEPAVAQVIRGSGALEDVFMWTPESHEKLLKDTVYWARTVSSPPKKMAVIGFVSHLSEIQRRMEDIVETHRRGHPFVAIIHPKLEEDPKNREKLITIGIDGIVTDIPDVYVKLTKRAQLKRL